MNIKLAEKVFDNKLVKHLGDKVPPEKQKIYIRSFNEEDFVEVDYNNPSHKLKLIEWIARQIKAAKGSESIPLSIRLNEVIATNDTDKLVEIAESVLD